MASEIVVVPINFTQGLDTKSDERLVIPGRLLSAENLTLSETNALTRRDGHEVVVADGTFNGLTTHDSQLLAVSGSSLYTLSSGSLYEAGHVSPLTVTKTEIQRATRYQAEVDCGSDGRHKAFVWREYSADKTTVIGLFCTVVDEETGAHVVDALPISTSTTAYCPRVVAVTKTTNASDADAFIFVWAASAGIYARALRLSDMSLSAEATIASDNSDGTCLDAVSDQGNALVVYVSTALGRSLCGVHVKYSSGTVSANGSDIDLAVGTVPYATVVGVAVAPYGITHQGGQVHGAYVMAMSASGGSWSGVWETIISTTPSAMTELVAVTKRSTKCPSFAAGSFFIPAPPPSRVTAVAKTISGSYATMSVFHDQASAFSLSGTAGTQVPLSKFEVVVRSSASSFTVDSVTTGTLVMSNVYGSGAPNGPFIAGKALACSGSSYVPTYIGGIVSGNLNLQNSWFLLDEDGGVAAKGLQGSYGLWSATSQRTAAVTPPSSPNVLGRITCPTPERGTFTLASRASGTVDLTPVGLSSLNLNFYGDRSPQTARLGESTFFAGAVLSSFDGTRSVEHGFNYFPEGIFVTSSATTGSVDAGIHHYCAVYEWVDNAGQRQQSGPSPAFTVVAPGNRSMTVTIPTLSLTRKQNVNIGVYRTRTNGTAFHRVNPQDVPIYNVSSSAAVTFTENVVDELLVGGEPMATTAGRLPAFSPPPCSTVAVHRNRLFLGGLEDPSEVWYSQPQVNNFGVEFSDSLTERLDPNGGPLVGMVPMDQNLVLLCSRRPFAMAGDGLDELGNGDGFNVAEIASDVGCSDPRSILSMPYGAFFKSSKGWHLLERGGLVSYIGGAVKAYDSGSVSAVVLLDDRKEARVYSDENPTLVWSYDQSVNQWTTFDGQEATDAVWYPRGSAVYFTGPEGGISRDTKGEHSDAGAPIVTSLDTGWIRPSQGLHSFQSVRHLLLTGPYHGSGSLTVRAFYDYDSTELGSITVADTSELRSQDGNSWQLRWGLPRQTCEAVRFRITETPFSGSSGLSTTGMSLEVKLRNRAYKLPTRQTK